MLYYLQYEGLPLRSPYVAPIAWAHKTLFKWTLAERGMDDIFIYDASGSRRWSQIECGLGVYYFISIPTSAGSQQLAADSTVKQRGAEPIPSDVELFIYVMDCACVEVADKFT